MYQLFLEVTEFESMAEAEKAMDAFLKKAADIGLEGVTTGRVQEQEESALERFGNIMEKAGYPIRVNDPEQTPELSDLEDEHNLDDLDYYTTGN